jgi:hypothetical protein
VLGSSVAVHPPLRPPRLPRQRMWKRRRTTPGKWTPKGCEPRSVNYAVSPGQDTAIRPWTTLLESPRTRRHTNFANSKPNSVPSRISYNPVGGWHLRQRGASRACVNLALRALGIKCGGEYLGGAHFAAGGGSIGSMLALFSYLSGGCQSAIPWNTDPAREPAAHLCRGG